VRVHALLISYLKEHSSSFWSRAETQKHELIEHLEQVYREVCRLHSEIITPADFPEVKVFQQQLETMDWSTFHQLKHHEELLVQVNELLSVDLSMLLHEIVGSNSSLENPTSTSGVSMVNQSVESSPLMDPPVINDTNGGNHEGQPNSNHAATTRRRGKYHGEQVNLSETF
jgi:arginine deiminase